MSEPERDAAVGGDLPLKIVLTGGPGAGKTTVVTQLATAPEWADWRDEIGGVTAVPEAATQAYAARNTRWDRLDDTGRRDVQRAIYELQVEQEARLAEAARAAGHRVLLLDRGTIDGSAYWPDGPVAYWQALGSELADELARYAGVILLETAAAIGAYDGDATNAVRFEDADGAIESGRQLDRLWELHPHRTCVEAAQDFRDKVSQGAAAIGALLRAIEAKKGR